MSGKDFSESGLGIGGAGSHVEVPIVPSTRTANKIIEMSRRARRCRRCGQTDLFDGAMFTTNPGSGLCDDCGA